MVSVLTVEICSALVIVRAHTEQKYFLYAERARPSRRACPGIAFDVKLRRVLIIISRGRESQANMVRLIFDPFACY